MSNLTEEEKEAIEDFKQLLFQDRLTDYGKKQLVEILEEQQNEIKELKKKLDIRGDIIKIFEIKIEGQQKEIEELEDITRAYDGMQGIMPEGNPIVIADKEYFDSGRFTEKYISKDKIRKKIKELENKMEKYKKENKENSYFMANYDKSILQELLGDE